MNKVKGKGFILATVLSFNINNALAIECANNQTCGTDCCWAVEGSTLKITGNSSGTGTMDGYDKADNQPWKSYADTITSVDVSGVSNVGYRAFQYLDKLQNVTLGNSVKTVEHRAFWGTGVQSVDLNKVETVGLAAFNKSQLTSITMPNVTTIENKAFSNNNLSQVSIPEGVTSIGSDAFSYNNITEVSIPKSVTSIGSYAFYDNDLTSVSIPNGVTSLEEGAFSGNNLTSVSLPDGITSIPNRAFYGNNLTEVSIPDGVTNIGFASFYDNNLTSVSLPDSVTTIEDHAFYHNDLTSLELPDGLTSIGSGSLSSNPLTELVIPDSVTSLGDHALWGNTELKSLVLPEGITSIPTSFCDWCSSLESLVIPDSVTSIGEYAFDTCLVQRDENGKPIYNAEGTNFIAYTDENGEKVYALKNLVIPDTLENVDVRAFGSYRDNMSDLKISCKGDIAKCMASMSTVFPASDLCPTCTCTEHCFSAAQMVTASEAQCNSTDYYWNGSSCIREPDVSKRTCDHEYSGYVKVGNYCSSPENTYAKKHYTPAEALQWLKDDDNMIILTFKK